MAAPSKENQQLDVHGLKEETDVLQFRDPNQPNIHLVYWTRLSTPHEDKAGSNVLLWNHGLGEHCGRYKEMAATILGRVPSLDGVAAYDMRGHGKSEGMRGLARGINDFVRDLKEHVAPTLSLRFGTDSNIILGAHSLGGLVAAYAATGRDFLQAEGNGKIVGIALSAPAIENHVPGLINKLLVPISGPLCRIPGMRGMTKSNGIDASLLTHSEEDVKKYKEDPLVHSQIGLGVGADIFSYGKDVLRMVEDNDAMLLTSAPVLIVHGEEDLIVKVEGSRKLHEAIQKRGGKVRLTVAPHAYHEIHNERVENGRSVFYDSVSEFLNDTLSGN